MADPISPTVTVDLVGAVSSHSLMGGWDVTRGAVVENLNVNGGLGTADIVQLAEAALISTLINMGEGSGDRGSQWRAFGVPVILKSFDHEVISANAVRSKIHYKGLPVVVLEVDSCLGQIQTNLDMDGHPITVAYQYPADYPGDHKWVTGAPIVQGGLVSLDVPERIISLRATLVDQVSGGVMTTALSQLNTLSALIGKLNDASFTILEFTGLARTWRVDKARGTSDDGGRTYKFDIVFHYREATWDDPVTFINPDTGKPPPDLVDGVGYKKPAVRKQATFPSLAYLF